MAELRSYSPSLRQRLGNLVYDAYRGAGMPGTGDNVRNTLGNLIDFVPIAGDAVGINDASRDIQAGNYGRGIAGIGLAALGLMPGVGDAVSSGGRKLFYRATNRSTPLNDVGHMMFSDRGPEAVEHFGKHMYQVDIGEIPQESIVNAGDNKFKRRAMRALLEGQNRLNYARSDFPEFVRGFNPDDIIDNAGSWDNPDIAEVLYDNYLGKEGIEAIKTKDGLILLNPEYAKRMWGIGAAVGAAGASTLLGVGSGEAQAGERSPSDMPRLEGAMAQHRQGGIEPMTDINFDDLIPAKKNPAEISFDDLMHYSQPPEGFVFDPETGAMVDTKAVAERESQGVLDTLANFGAASVRGIPFLGEYFDEIAGGGDPVRTAIARERTKGFEERNPVASTAGKLGAGMALAVPLGMAAGPAAAAYAPASLGARAVAGIGLGGLGGALEGGISGYGAGTTPDERASEAARRAGWGGAVGGAVGGVAPVIGAGVNAVTKRIADAMTIGKKAKAAGLSRESTDAVLRAMDADMTDEGAARVASMGQDAMLADAGPSAASLLDTAMQRGGVGGRIARNAIEGRAVEANKRLSATMDDVLGVPVGAKAGARDIAKSSAPARSAAYDLAYSRPIDYAADTGRAIEDVFARVPGRTLKAAISEANDAMKVEGRKNLQIMADIADDGSVKFREMPNVEQLDFLKRALDEQGRRAVDQFGRPTAEGLRARGLAADLRGAIGAAVPEYDAAIKLGGDKIAEDEAYKLGRSLLDAKTTREDVADGVAGLSDAASSRLRQGLRGRIDDTLANVRQVMTDRNIDAREAAKAVGDFSSRSARSKVDMALGSARSQALYDELAKTQQAVGLRAQVAQNSKTYPRLAVDRSIKDGLDEGIVGAVKRGEPANATKRLVQAMTGATNKARLAQEDRIYEEIARLLVEKRGTDALATLASLRQMGVQVPENALLAEMIGRRAALGSGVLGYVGGRESVK